MKILFSHSYFLRFDQKQWAASQPYAPLGTMYAAALMRENGYDVTIHDVMFSHKANEVTEALDSYRPDLFVLYDDGFNYLTKMCLTNMRDAAYEMIRIASARGIKIIVSSSDSTDHYTDYLATGADFIILGEAEASLLELTAAIENHATDLTSINGIAFKSATGVTKNPPRPVLKDLDALPFPAWDLIDIDNYRDAWLKSSGYFSINMATTRGCPFKCEFCLSALDKTAWPFEINRFLEEMENLHARGARLFKFVDRTFNLNIKTSLKIMQFFLDKLEANPDLLSAAMSIANELVGQLKGHKVLQRSSIINK